MIAAVKLRKRSTCISLHTAELSKRQPGWLETETQSSLVYALPKCEAYTRKSILNIIRSTSGASLNYFGRTADRIAVNDAHQNEQVNASLHASIRWIHMGIWVLRELLNVGMWGLPQRWAMDWTKWPICHMVHTCITSTKPRDSTWCNWWEPHLNRKFKWSAIHWSPSI